MSEVRVFAFLFFLISSNIAVSRAGESDGFFICQDSGRPIPMDYVCDGYEDCSDGTDEFDCGSAFKCESYEFQCASVDKCVNMVFRCDGHNHCQDGSDEKGCGQRTCKEWEFTCGNGNCIPELYQCDQDDDCGDNSDEAQCTVEGCNPETEWSCVANGQCISKNWRCDYEKDCPDGSDEKGCTVFNHRCGAGLFNCSQTECISSNKLCDGEADCKTNPGADEDHSICVVLECGFGKFACPEKCLDSEDLVCNGNYDCMDGSDEIGCATSLCNANEFQCIEGTTCFGLNKRCNGVEDCMDESDEFLCSSTVYLNCSDGEYRCDDGLQCIPEILLCDGVEQCGDGSDESYCSNMTISEDGTNSCLVNNGGCEHKCNYIINRFHYCSCNHGYVIDANSRSSCIDIDECDVQYGICDQVCTNTVNGYACSCADGYVNSGEHDRCKATGPAVNLVFTNWYDVQQLNVRTGQLNYTLNGLISATAVDYHYRHGLVFWTDIHLQVIMRAKFDGTDERVVADLGIARPEGIAIDWLNDRIYWTDSELDRVEVANIDGNGRAVLFSGLKHPRDIIVDPINRIMFWTEENKIVRASLDGSYKTTFLSDISNYISWPTGLAIDLPSQTLYWVDAGTRSIGSCTLDGKHPRLLYNGNITHPFGIAVFDDTIYWTDRNLGGIYSINRLTGKSFRKVLVEVFKPLDIVGVHPLKQPLNQSDLIDLCSIDNGGCDYLCISGTNNRTCHCPAFRNLLPDKRSCSKMDFFMLFSMSDQIHVFSLESSSRYDVKLPLRNLDMSNIAVMDWDSKHDLIFWGDSSTNTINSASINGSSQRVLVNVDVNTPAGMAVDWTNDKLYWTDSDLGRIYVSEINGSSVSAIVTVNEGTLTSIAVYPAKGLLFYGINVNDKKSFIRSAHLDGTNNRKVGSYDNSIPMLMTIDYQSDRLYWIDNINIKLLSIFINGSDFEELLESGTLYESKGLTHHGNYLYWTDEIDGSIYQIEKEPPYETKKLISNREDLRDISVFHRNREIPNSHPCWSDNGGCSHLCFGVPSENDNDEYTVTFTASCGCPTGYVLGDDAKTCASEIDQFLLFGTVSRIGMMSLEVDRNIDITTPIYPKPTKVLSVDYDLKNDYVYWIEEDSPIIYRAPIDGGDKEIVIRYDLVRPTALAVDWLGGNLYFGDSGSRRLEVCRLDGSSRKVLISDNNVGEVLSITVDLYSEYIFWSSSEPSPQVFRSAMDGSNTMAIIHSSEVSLPVSLAVDNRGASSKLFVADSGRQRIKVFDTNGKGQDLFKITDSPITGLAVDEDYVYWIDGDTGILHRSRKDDSSQSNRVNTNLMGVSDLRLIRKTHLLQNRALSHNYACKEGLCSHLCLPNWDINRYSCACPTGIEDQVNCPAAPSLYLLFTTSNSIRRLSLESNEYHDVSLISDLRKVSYIDYRLTSSNEGRIYWTDPVNQSIMMADIDGSNTRSFLQFRNNLRGVSVDWTTGSVYYVNAGVPSIEMADSTGTFVKVILNDSVVQDPVDLAVFPLEGFLFWTEWNGSPSRLMRSKMDGSDPVTVETLDNQKPTHLTLSTDTGYLYWVDANSGSIQRIKYDGTHYEVVWRDIGQPFGVAVYQQSVFWSDVIEGMIYRCDSQRQLTQKRMQYVERHSGTPKGMVIVTLNRKGEVDGNYSGSACGYKNGGCRYLCAPISQEERKCLCPSSQPDCVEYAGIHSWTIPPSLVSTTTAAVPTISATSTTATVATNSFSSSPTPAVQIDSEIIGAILDNVSITVLVFIGIFLVAIVFVLCFILLLFSKYKSLATHHEPAPSSKYELKSLDNKPTTRSLMATNPLYEKTTITASEGEGKAKASASSKFSGPSYQLNNTVELQTRNKDNARNIRLRSLIPHAEPELKPKLKVMNTTTLNVPLTEEPGEYKITPVQSRRNHSSSKSSSSPPPTEVPITVHYPDSSPTHKPSGGNVSLPQPPPRPAIVTASSPTKGTRHVQFATSVVEAPPVPPRSGRLSSCGSSFNQTVVSLDYDPSPPPLSAPATSPPPTFSFHDISITVPAEYIVSARNPIFGRCSSSSESDISGMRDQQEDETGGRDGGLSKEMSAFAGFASDSNIVFQ